MDDFESVEELNYYEELRTINSHQILRRLWINEGKRRGYVWEDSNG